MEILHLTLLKKWFDLIAKGEKKQEYRAWNNYWQTRLISEEEPGGFKVFDEIHFKNGYRKDCPFMRVEFKGISCSSKMFHTPLNGENLPKEFFIIKLGEILEIKNWSK